MEKGKTTFNATTVTEFLLLGFSDTSVLRMVHIQYGWYIFSMAQICLIPVFGFAELALLTVMAYDRYIAICYPLHYQLLMNKIKCFSMVVGCWVSGMIYGAMHTLNIIILPFCGPNNINQLFCDSSHVLKLACADTFGNNIAIILSSIILSTIFCSSVIASYVRIFLTVQKIPSFQGRYKAYSTCLPHLAVFSLFMSTGLFTYFKKASESSFFTEILAAFLFCTVSPVLNPVIYSLRNKEIKAALGKFILRFFWYRESLSTKKRERKRHHNLNNFNFIEKS